MGHFFHHFIHWAHTAARINCRESHMRLKCSERGHRHTFSLLSYSSLVPITPRGRGLWWSQLHYQPPEEKVKGRLDKLAYLNMNPCSLFPLSFMPTQMHSEQSWVHFQEVRMLMNPLSRESGKPLTFIWLANLTLAISVTLSLLCSSWIYVHFHLNLKV